MMRSRDTGASPEPVPNLGVFIVATGRESDCKPEIIRWVLCYGYRFQAFSFQHPTPVHFPTRVMGWLGRNGVCWIVLIFLSCMLLIRNVRHSHSDDSISLFSHSEKKSIELFSARGFGIRTSVVTLYGRIPQQKVGFQSQKAISRRLQALSPRWTHWNLKRVSCIVLSEGSRGLWTQRESQSFLACGAATKFALLRVNSLSSCRHLLSWRMLVDRSTAKVGRNRRVGSLQTALATSFFCPIFK